MKVSHFRANYLETFRHSRNLNSLTFLSERRFGGFLFEFKINKNEAHLNKILNDTLIDIYKKQYES